jgi:hypothetical protein
MPDLVVVNAGFNSIGVLLGSGYRRFSEACELLLLGERGFRSYRQLYPRRGIG